MATIGTLAVNIVARTSKFTRGVMGVQRLSARGAMALSALGAGAAAAGVAMIRSAENIERAMTKSLAIMSDVSDTMRNDMVEAANRVAKETEASTAQAAESYFFLASAGLSAEQSLKAMPVVAKFAQAGNFDLALATDLVTDAQSALGLSSKDTATAIENMTRVSDVLVKANTLANASVEQFSVALTNGAAAALRLVNKDMEEGVAVLAAYADQGIKAQEAGTAFGIVMRDLQTKAIQNKTAFKAAGVAVFDAAGNMNNLADIVEDLEQLLAGLSDEQSKLTLLQLGFSDKSVKYIQSLIGTSEKIKEYEKNLRNASGTAADVAAKSMTDLQRATEQLQGSWDKLSLAVGDTAEKLGLFKAGAEGAEGAAVILNELVGEGGKGKSQIDLVEAATTKGTFNPLRGTKNVFDWMLGGVANEVGPANPEWSKKWEERVAKAGGVDEFVQQEDNAKVREFFGGMFRDGLGAVQGAGRRGAMQFGRGVDAIDSAKRAAEKATLDRFLGNTTFGLLGTPGGSGGGKTGRDMESIAELERNLQSASMDSRSRRPMGSLSLTRSGSVESYRLRRRMERQNEGNKTEKSMDKTLKSINEKLSGGVVLAPANIA